MELFKLFGTIAINNSDANNAIDDTTDKAETSEGKMSEAFKKIGSAVVTYLAVDKIKDFGLKCVEMASDVQEVQNKFDVVFQGMTDDVEQWAKKYADSIGRNKNTIKTYLADNQNMFVGMGMTREEGAKLSEQMVELGLDLASFNNLQEDDAVNALSKALMGETESAKRLGAVLNDNTLAMAQEQLGYQGKFKDLTEAQKMEVRYQAILNQSADAVGDCERSLDSYKGRQIQAKSAMENLQQTIGARLIPVMTFLTEKFGGLVNTITDYVNPAFDTIEEVAEIIGAYWAENLSPTIESVKDGFSAIWDALQPVIQGFADMFPKVESNKSAIDILKGALDAVNNALKWVADKLQAVATWMSEHQTAVQIMATIIGAVAAAIVLVNVAVAAWNIVAGIATTVTTALGAAVAFLTSPIGIAIAAIAALIAIGVLLYQNWETVKEKTIEIFNKIKDKVSGIVTGIKDAISDAFEKAKDIAVGIFETLKDVVVGIWDGIWTGIKTVINFILGGIEGMCNGMVRAVNVLLGGISDVANAAGWLIGLDPIDLRLSEVSIPRLATGGVLEKGQLGLLEGDGAEAVVPLEKNREWIAKVSEEMQVQGIGGNDETMNVLKGILAAMNEMNEELPERLKDSIANLKFSINNREFARLVKAV